MNLLPRKFFVIQYRSWFHENFALRKIPAIRYIRSLQYKQENISEVVGLFPLSSPYHSSAMCTRFSTSSLPLWMPTITLFTCWYSAPSSVTSAPGSMKGRKCDLDFEGICRREVSVRIVICQYVHTVRE